MLSMFFEKIVVLATLFDIMHKSTCKARSYRAPQVLFSCHLAAKYSEIPTA